jgi:hypothetical protein
MSPIVQAPISPGFWRETRWGSSSRAATIREGAFERFGDEGTSVGKEDLSELQGDQESWGGARHLLKESEAQAAAGLGEG